MKTLLTIIAIGVWIILLVQAPGPILLVTIIGLFTISIFKRK